MDDCLNSPKLKIDVGRLIGGVLDRDDFEATLRLAITDEGLCLADNGDPFRVRLELERLHGGIRVHGTVKGTVAMECSRCLEPFEQPLVVNLDEVYRFTDAQETARHVSSERVEDDSYRVQEGILDLNQALNDAITLAVPMKPLCLPDCRGICPLCGVNRNLQGCECVEEEIDPRLEVLKRLLDREQG